VGGYKSWAVAFINCRINGLVWLNQWKSWARLSQWSTPTVELPLPEEQEHVMSHIEWLIDILGTTLIFVKNHTSKNYYN
jgi:hypothetical protein